MATLEYERVTTEHDVGWFIDTVIVRDIKSVIDCGSGYLAFGLIAQAIETLGGFLDEKDTHEPSQAEKRFGKAITDLFKFNDLYEKHNRTNSPYYLYEHLRCGMAHVLRPKARIVFTCRADAEALRLVNLQEAALDFTEPQLILVLEDIYNDLVKACDRAKALLPKKTHPKLKRGYLATHQFKYSFSYDGPPLEFALKPGSEIMLSTPTLSCGHFTNFFVQPPT